MNIVALIGRLVADPEVRSIPSGRSVVSFTLAVNRPYSKEGTQATDFIDCVAWRSTAEFIGRNFHKGSLMGVSGSIQTRNYEDKQGQKRKAVEVVVDEVSFAEGKNSTPSAPKQMQMPKGFDPVPEFSADDGDLPF